LRLLPVSFSDERAPFELAVTIAPRLGGGRVAQVVQADLAAGGSSARNARQGNPAVAGEPSTQQY
jgi:hypothetical protein